MTGHDWFAGLVLGAWAGFLLIYGVVIGLALIVTFTVLAGIRRSAAAIGGLLAGAGGSLLVILALANLNCAGAFASDGESCTPPDLTGWFVTGSLLALVGVGLTVRVALRNRRGP
jgi:hypothetical protein